jgi:hypothetical protein
MINNNKFYLILLLIPVFCLWWLDAFFLCHERNYRNRYNQLVKFNKQYLTKQDIEPIQLLEFYNLTLGSIDETVLNCNFCNILKCAKSTPLLILYGLPVLLNFYVWISSCFVNNMICIRGILCIDVMN